jgi:lyso-ornithine lipid O-acyltransferase
MAVHMTNEHSEAGDGVTQKQSAWEEFAGLTWADLRRTGVRAPFRLVGLFAATSVKVVELMFARLMGRWTPELALSKATKWAQQVLVVCGIEATLEGEVPPGPMLLVANHRSYIDIAPILAHVSCAFVAKSELRSWPLLGKGASLGNTVFVERGNSASRKATRNAIIEKLQTGTSVVVFPEGTTSRGPGMLPFRPGVFNTLAGSGFPVVPVAIDYEDPEAAYVGDDTFLGNFLRVFSHRHTRLSVSFGPPLQDTNSDLLRKGAEGWVEERLAKQTSPPDCSSASPPRPLDSSRGGTRPHAPPDQIVR